MRRVALKTLAAEKMYDSKKFTFILRSPTFNLDTIDRSFNNIQAGGSHLVKIIAGDNNDCWWRAAWLSILIQHAIKDVPVPAKNTQVRESQFEKIILRQLGDEYAADAKNAARMIDAIRTVGCHSILTNIDGANLGGDFANDSKLKLPSEDKSIGETHGENVCRRLTEALMKKHGFSEEETAFSVVDDDLGDTTMIHALSHSLACDMVLYNNPPVNVNFDRHEVWVGPHEDSTLNHLDVDTNDPASPTTELIKMLAQTPVLLRRRDHFNLAIPRRVISSNC